jgi:hypothetical protein
MALETLICCSSSRNANASSSEGSFGYPSARQHTTTSLLVTAVYTHDYPASGGVAMLEQRAERLVLTSFVKN